MGVCTHQLQPFTAHGQSSMAEAGTCLGPISSSTTDSFFLGDRDKRYGREVVFQKDFFPEPILAANCLRREKSLLPPSEPSPTRYSQSLMTAGEDGGSYYTQRFLCDFPSFLPLLQEVAAPPVRPGVVCNCFVYINSNNNGNNTMISKMEVCWFV